MCQKGCITLPHVLMPVLVQWGTTYFQTLSCYGLISTAHPKIQQQKHLGLSCIMQLDNLIIPQFHPLNTSILVLTVSFRLVWSNELLQRSPSDDRKFSLTFHLNVTSWLSPGDAKKSYVLNNLTPLESCCIKDGPGNLSTYKHISWLFSTFPENI